MLLVLLLVMTCEEIPDLKRFYNDSAPFRDSINCPEYKNWKKAYQKGGYSPFEPSGLSLENQHLDRSSLKPLKMCHLKE